MGTHSVRQRFERTLLDSWRTPNALTLALLPLSLLYLMLATLSRWRYTWGLASRRKAPVATLVVGNLTVGGSGKSPLVAALVSALQEHGLRVGVVSRGYKSQVATHAQLVDRQSSPRQVGDEPYMLSLQGSAPIAVGADRHAAISALLERHPLDVIVCDDGLQHWALRPTATICIDDQTVASHNHWMLPAGPYREPRCRLKAMDEVVTHVSPDCAQAHLDEGAELGPTDYDNRLNHSRFWLQPQAVRLVRTLGPASAATNKAEHGDAAACLAPGTVNLVAGIAKPERFFATAAALGFAGPEHCFSDHHDFCAEDFAFKNDWPILMTEKDAVKCRVFASERLWYLPVRAQLDRAMVMRVVERLRQA